MFGQVAPVLHFRRPIPTALHAIVLALLLLATTALDAVAVAAENPSGLPLPRFVTTRSNPINVRIGPGTKYGVAWVYLKAGTPVEIIQEFDTWRKIRDADGSEGWLHQNLLQGKRAGLVTPRKTDGEDLPLLKSRDANSGVRAWLGPNFRVDIKECDGTWCEVVATAHPANGSPQSFDGFLAQDDLWGVYKGETFD